MSKSECKAAKQMTRTMDETMQRLHERFQAMSEQLEGQNEMGTRIISLEKSVTELTAQAGMDKQPISKVADLLSD